jgi:hypothetical protein
MAVTIFRGDRNVRALGRRGLEMVRQEAPSWGRSFLLGESAIAKGIHSAPSLEGPGFRVEAGSFPGTAQTSEPVSVTKFVPAISICMSAESPFAGPTAIDAIAAAAYPTHLTDRSSPIH